MIRPILFHGASALHTPAAPVLDTSSDVRQLIDDMIETMHRAPGIGLAAPQVGASLRLFVIDLSIGARAEDLIVLVNPVFAEREGLQLEDEGCLSLPGLSASVPRPLRAVVRGTDRNGQPVAVEGTGLLARALQHEMDHLDGRLYVDRLNRPQRWALMRQAASLRARNGW
ncbi:MAG: peptide deformylase [Vicinamibacterales bacterium]